jgi:hypothetical protein
MHEELGISENAACVPAPHFFGAYRRSYSYMIAINWSSFLLSAFEYPGIEVN